MMKKIKNLRNIVLSVMLLAGISFSVIWVARGATPNPGHNFSAIGGGVLQGDVLYGSAADTLAALAKDANATRYLSNTGTSNNPAWAQINLTNGVTGNLPVGNGGTGTNSLTANNLILGNGSSAVQFVAPGASGNALVSNGTTWTSSNMVSGTLVSRTVLTGGTSFTTSATTNKILVQMVGGGGGGGGATGGSTQVSVGGGGGSGSYAEKIFAVSPGTAYTYAIGAAGAAGSATGSGGTGGNTTFAVSTTTVTANGGAGGIYLATGTTVVSALGGAGGAVSTNGDLNNPGQPGGYGLRLSSTAGVSGTGALSRFGAGGNSRNTAGAGNAGGNYGSGGGGAMSTSTTGYTGGIGTAGAIIVWEFE